MQDERRPSSRESRWLAAGTVAAALLAYLVTHHGLIAQPFLPAVQAGAFVGLVAALPAQTARRAALLAAAGAAFGVLIEAPAADGPHVLLALETVGTAAVVAAGARAAVDSGALRRQFVVGFGVLLIVGNLWLTTATLGPTRVVLEGKTMWQFVTSSPQPGTRQPDEEFFVAVYHKMKAGTPYYQAFRQAYHEIASPRFGGDPPGVAAVREPALLTFLAALPGDGRSIVWAMVALATAAAAGAFVLSRELATPSVRLVSVAAVAAYLLYFSTLPFLTDTEAWGGALAVVCAGLFAAATTAERRSHRRGLMAAAAAIAVAAVAVRELMVFLLVAGIAGAALAPREERPYDLGVWLGAATVSAGAYAAHVRFAQRIVTPGAGLEIWAGRGSLGNVVLGIVHGASNISALVPVLLILAVLGVAGASAQPGLQRRVFALVALIAPLLFFTYAWNGAIDYATARHVNYWGSIVDPLLFAYAPSALLFLPGMRRPAAAAVELERKAT